MIAVDFVDDERLTITLTIFDPEGEPHELKPLLIRVLLVQSFYLCDSLNNWNYRAKACN